MIIQLIILILIILIISISIHGSTGKTTPKIEEPGEFMESYGELMDDPVDYKKRKLKSQYISLRILLSEK